MKEQIKVKSSSSPDIIYNVDFDVELDKIKIECDCKAGINKVLCKHRLDLIDGDVTNLVNKQDSEKVHKILSILDRNKIENEFLKIKEIEFKIKNLNKLKKELRKSFGHKLSNGF